MESDNNHKTSERPHSNKKMNEVQNGMTKMKSFAGEMWAHCDYVILALYILQTTQSYSLLSLFLCSNICCCFSPRFCPHKNKCCVFTEPKIITQFRSLCEFTHLLKTRVCFLVRCVYLVEYKLICSASFIWDNKWHGNNNYYAY